jgi:hypothetical protein
MILRYNNFISDDLLFESLINETYVYYIEDFKDVLLALKKNSEKNITGNIASDLIDLEYTEPKSGDMTFISLSNKQEGYVGTSTLRGLKNSIEKSFKEWSKSNDVSDDDHKNLLNTLDKIEKGTTSQSDVNNLFNEYELGTKSRNDVKLGRLINVLLPGKYTSNDIEEFTNKFKATLKNKGVYFDEVYGEDINHWYNSDNYKEMSGPLGNSCMARKSGLFKIYTENPDVCRLVILVENGELIGRALVWKLKSLEIYGKDTPQDIWFMDRQYTIKDSDVEKFKDYAKDKDKEGVENGTGRWIYKAYNNHHSYETVVIDGEEKRAKMTIEVKATNYNKYPYMDTFKRFDPKEGILYNDDEDGEDYKGNFILNETDGGYEEVESGVWSNWYDRRIPEGRHVWSDWADSYLDRDRAIQINAGSNRWRGEWFPDDCDDLVYDEWLDEYIYTDDSVYSEAYGYSLYDANAVEVIKEIDSDGEAMGADSNWYHKDDDDIIRVSEYRSQTWYKVLSEEWSSWRNYDWSLRELFILDYKDEPIPSLFKLETYKIVGEKPEELEDIEYLSEVDALLLGVKVNNDKERLTDKFAYEDSILPIRDMIKSKLESEIKRIEDIIEEEGQLQIKFSDEDKDNYRRQIKKRLERYQSRIQEINTNQFIEK